MTRAQVKRVSRPDAFVDPAREEMLHSLLDGTARWPDGRPRSEPAPVNDTRLREGAPQCL